MERIINPQQPQLNVNHHSQFPFSTPVSLTIQHGAGADIHVFGGLSPRQQLAAQMLAGCVCRGLHPREAVRSALEMADALLAESPPEKGAQNGQET